MEKQKVIFDHDGGVDDLLSLMLLLTMEHVDLLAVTVTPADCYLSDAVTSTLKILSLFGRDEVLVAEGRLHGKNAFPADWRAQPKICNALPNMIAQPINQAQQVPEPADELITRLLTEHNNVRVLLTGPCSNFVAAIQGHEEIKSSVQDVVWMGGAVDVAGNVAMHNHDTSAEWNAYWDPVATKSLIEMGVPIKLIALDGTNCLPVNMTFLQQLATQRDFPISQLAGQFWATTINTIPSYEFTYYMWDILATCELGIDKGAINYEKCELAVSVSEPNEGQTLRSEGSGCWVDVAKEVDKDKVLAYVLKQLKR